jgi:hypothetical protein
MRPTVRAETARAALSVSASARRVVVRPLSRFRPAAETKATSKLSPERNSAAQRPPIMRRFWSTSPGVTITCTASACRSSAIAGEFVTSVRALGGPRSRRRASARQVVEESTKIVEPSSTQPAAWAPISSLAARAWLSRFVQSVSMAGASLRTARAPPCTRSTRPAPASRSRSR